MAHSAQPIDIARLRAAREAAGMTQAEAAALASISQNHWSNIEAGQREASITTLRAMARAVGLSVRDLVLD